MASNDKNQWFVLIEGQQHGPYSSESLSTWLKEGRLSQNDVVWKEGIKDWIPIEEALANLQRPKPPPPPKRSVTETPEQFPEASGSSGESNGNKDGFENLAQSIGVASDKSIEISRHPGFRGWLNRWGIRILPILAVVGVTTKIIHSCGGIGPGSVTFAEKVDPNTLKTTNEDTVFSTGWVNMVVRGTSEFDDTHLISYARSHGAEGEQVLMEHTVDKKWQMFSAPIFLQNPGVFDIVVKNSDGDVIAEGTVTIVEQ